MRSKAPLVLMEQIVMLLVFALAAAVCLQAFVKSDQLSQASADRDQAVIVAQNAAETLKNYGLSGRTVADMYIRYDADWQTTNAAGSRFALSARRTATDIPGLAAANIQVVDEADGKLLFSLDIAWQEQLPANKQQPAPAGGEQ